MKIGTLVKNSIGSIFRYCESNDHQEFLRLQDVDYCKKVFGINFPFCVAVDAIEIGRSKRFWTEIYLVRGVSVRVSSQWFESSRASFLGYLKEKSLSIPDVFHAVGEPTKKATLPGRRPRYGESHIANAQNLFIRNILGNIGFESFSEKDWIDTRDCFGNACAYCGAKTKLIMEHAVPINRERLGEHRLGNLVPSCYPCNARKGNKTYREFLEGNIDAIAKIDAYMDSKNYVPLEQNEQFKKILDLAYREVELLRDRYVAIINQLF
ncbi:HNH endonuclease [Chitinimonas taiwanensis]|uniref:HNH endonuclease n=1 Tax=Chitinimonas taiwanensis TaxID=240412 RepID=UPI00092FE19F|nr:HNH endonuclease [Chitinimonas taiwanensis]